MPRALSQPPPRAAKGRPKAKFTPPSDQIAYGGDRSDDVGAFREQLVKLDREPLAVGNGHLVSCSLGSLAQASTGLSQLSMEGCYPSSNWLKPVVDWVA